MVYSLFLSKNLVTQDVVIIYGDIIFDHNIYEVLKERKNLLPVNVNWLENWKRRMKMTNILKDAENLIIKNGKLFEIGTELKKTKLPTPVYGYNQIKKRFIYKMCKFFQNLLRNNKIDMTSFIHLCVKKI